MFKDEQRNKVWSEIRQHDLRSFASMLPQEVIFEAAKEAGVSLGDSALNLANLAWLGVASTFHHSLTFAKVLTTTLQCLQDQQAFSSTTIGQAKKKGRRNENRHKAKQKSQKRNGNFRQRRSKHDPRRADPTAISEEAFAQARQRVPLAFWLTLIVLLAKIFQRDHGNHVVMYGFRLLALDGTTWDLENWKALRDHYGTPKNGARKKAAPQARMLALIFPTVRVPLAYNIGPISSSEQALAVPLLGYLQANDLLLMDRGFFSYGIFWQIQLRKAYFGIRLKKGVKLKTVHRISSKERIVEWTPRDTRGRWKSLPKTMRLRVINYKIPGFRASAIVTNVLDRKRISREDWVRLAEECHDRGQLKPGLYHRRWEIETTFRELKVTLNAKFRSRTVASLEYEIGGRMVYYLLVRWLIVKSAEKHGIDPLRISFSAAVQEIEEMNATLMTSDLSWVNRVLIPRLLNRVAQHVVPARPGRHYPRPKDDKPKNKGNGQIQLPAKLTSTKNRKSKHTLNKTSNMGGKA